MPREGVSEVAEDDGWNGTAEPQNLAPDRDRHPSPVTPRISGLARGNRQGVSCPVRWRVMAAQSY